MNPNCSVAVQCTLRVSSHNTGINAVSCVIQARAPQGRALRTQVPRMWTCSPRSSSRESRGASTAARTQAPQNSATFALQIVHWAKKFRHIPAGQRGPANSTSYVSPKCVVVNTSRTLKGSRICTHVSMKSFAGCAVRDLRLGR